MKKVDKLRQEYEEIQTPQDLDSFMDTCIDQAQKKQSRFTFYRLWKPALSAALIGYLIVLNTVPAFAQSVFAIPLLGDVSRILCVREYQKTSDVDSLSVKVPEVKNTGNPEMEERVNKQIEERINKTTEQLYKDSAQVREMMKKEKVESLTAKTEVTIDYKITCNQKNQHILPDYDKLSAEYLHAGISDLQSGFIQWKRHHTAGFVWQGL